MAKLEIKYEDWKRLPVGSVDFAPQRSIYDITREFIHSINPNITTTFIENEFYAICSINRINVTFLPDDMDGMFDTFVYKHFGVHISPLLMGILHEIGHIETFDEQLDRERSIIYYLLDIDFDIKRYRDFTNMYFAIPSKFEATRWGVEYYLSHKEHCDNFLKEIGYEA